MQILGAIVATLLSVGFFIYTLTMLALRQWAKVTAMVVALDVVFAVFLVLRNAVV